MLSSLIRTMLWAPLLFIPSTTAFAVPVEALSNPLPTFSPSLVPRDNNLLPRQGTWPALGWRFQIQGHLFINDDEVGQDETWEGDFSWPTFTLRASQSNTYSFTKGMGGEIRVEISLTATTFAYGTGLPRINYNIKLFEGTSEDTTDLDGQLTGDVTTVRNGFTGIDAAGNIDVTVRNTEENVPNDYAHLTVSILATPIVV